MTTIQPPLPPTPQPTQAQTPVEGEVVTAQVAKLPESLAATDRAITLKGEVIAQNPDGTVRIATPRGPIDVKLPEGQQVQRGQTVEVQVPAGAPPRTVAVTLPQQPQPVPQPQVPQQPLPQVPVQQQPLPQLPVTGTLPTQQPLPPVITQPHVTDGKPALPATQNQAPANTPQNQNAAASAPADAGVSPKGLLDFLKTTLQTALKTGPSEQAPQGPQVFTQRPLAIGQLARLTPLMPNQQVIQQAQTIQTGAVQVFAKAAGSLQFSAPQITAQTPVTTVALLQPTQTTTPLQSMMQTVLGNTVNLGIPHAAAPDPIARLLLPVLSLLQAATPQTTTPQTVNLQTASLQLASALVKTETLNLTPLPHQKPVTVAATPNATHILPATDVRVAAMVPTAPLTVLQNPQNATLLHGTPASPVLFATVKGETPQGLPVIELTTMTTLPDGTQKPAPTTMVLQFPARGLAPATVLQLSVLPQTQPVSIAAAPITATTTLPWASIDDALRVLHAEPQGQTAISMLQAALPKPTGAAGFAAPVLMFVAALRSGDVANWIGEKTADLLKVTKRGEALARISSDFAAQSRESADAPKGEWKSMALPMAFGQEVGRITLHTRAFERDDETNPAKRASGTRFVMDVNLTRMGDLQIDGFSLEKKLDVTLRTEQHLSPAMRESVRARYANALQGIGFAGHLNFSADRKTWISFEAEERKTGASARV